MISLEQLMTDAELDERLTRGESLREHEIQKISPHHLRLLQASGLKKTRGGTYKLKTQKEPT